MQRTKSCRVSCFNVNLFLSSQQFNYLEITSLDRAMHRCNAIFRFCIDVDAWGRDKLADRIDIAARHRDV